MAFLLSQKPKYSYQLMWQDCSKHIHSQKEHEMFLCACCCFVLKIFLNKVFLDAERICLILITAGMPIFFSCCYKENTFFIFLFIC